jgi:hypothetical protein
MPETIRRANNAKSEIRARVEHVFAEQKDRMRLFIRTIGITGTFGNFVREAMMMERGESSHGYRERTSGPVACRARSEHGRKGYQGRSPWLVGYLLLARRVLPSMCAAV